MLNAYFLPSVLLNLLLLLVIKASVRHSTRFTLKVVIITPDIVSRIMNTGPVYTAFSVPDVF